MLCPVCEATPLTMSERNGIEIDYCPKCRGVWLDRGELDKIIDRAAPTSATREPSPPVSTPTYPAQQAHYQQNHYPSDSRYYKKKKHESFLGELFDFD